MDIFSRKNALSKVLKAFLTSTFMMMETLSETCSEELTNCLAACTAASQPPGVPTPSCLGLNLVADRPQVYFEQIFAANLRYKLPTAIALMPPSFLDRAQRESPNSAPQTKLGIFPERKIFINEVNNDRGRQPSAVSLLNICCR